MILKGILHELYKGRTIDLSYHYLENKKRSIQPYTSTCCNITSNSRLVVDEDYKVTFRLETAKTITFAHNKHVGGSRRN